MYFRSIKLAPLWKRYFAVLIDISLLLSIVYLSSSLRNSFFSSIIFIFCILYFPLLDSSKLQGTLGKKLFFIKVINYNGMRISYKQAFMRFFGYFIYTIPFLIVSVYGVSQGFHNHFSETKVVNNNFSKTKIRIRRKEKLGLSININKLISTRLKIYNIINILTFFLIYNLLVRRLMQKAIFITIFHKLYEKKYHRYLKYKRNIQKKRKWILSKKLFLVFIFFSISLIFFFVGLRIMSIQNFIYIDISILFFALSYGLYKLAQIYFLPEAKKLIKKDSRKPIVLLHSFEDNNLSILTYPMLFGIRGNIRLEEAISPILNEVGPFISIGNPQNWIPKLGTAKAFEKDESWQSRVLDWMKEAQYLVFMINDSIGLEWELRKAIEYNYISKIMIVFPDSETKNYQERILFVEKFFKEYDMKISLPFNLKLLFFDSNNNSISIISNQCYQEEYEEAINLFLYYKDNSRDFKLFPYL